MADKTKTVDGYVAALPPEQQAIVTELRRLIRLAAPEAVESIKWAQPVYEVNGPVAYIKAFATRVNFGFWRGAQLKDTRGLLSGGDKMKHVKLEKAGDIQAAAFTQFVREAVKLNRKLGDPTKPQRPR
jgi:hypothetical protein